MPNIRQTITEILICMLLPQVLFVGCASVRAVTGPEITADDPADISFLTSGTVREGTVLVVTRRDSTEVRGKFLRVSTVNETSVGRPPAEGNGDADPGSIRSPIHAATRLVLKVDAGTLSLPLSDIVSVEAEGDRYAPYTGAGTGVPLGIAFIAVLKCR